MCVGHRKARVHAKHAEDELDPARLRNRAVHAPNRIGSRPREAGTSGCFVRYWWLRALLVFKAVGCTRCSPVMGSSAWVGVRAAPALRRFGGRAAP